MLKEVEDLVDLIRTSNPNSYHVHRLRGFLAVANEDLDEAIDQFRKADAVKPKQPELRYALAQILFRNKQAAEAEQISLQLIRDSPGYPNSYDFLAAYYRSQQQSGKAEAVLKQKVAAFPGLWSSHLGLAVFYMAANRRPEAETVINDMLAKASSVPDARSKTADLYFRLRDYDKARKVLEDATVAEPERRNEHRRRLAVMTFMQGQPKQALDAVEAIVKDDPNDNQSIALRAAMQLQSGDKDKSDAAINDLQSLLGKVQKSPSVRYNLARAYQARGDLDAARVQYMEAIKDASKTGRNFVAARIGLGQVALLKQDFGRAIESADAVLQAEPNNIAAQVIK